VFQQSHHRKYESKKPDTLFKVLHSFIMWVKHSGPSTRQAFAVDSASSPEDRFDSLYQSLRDMLNLLGDLGILSIRPGSCYLIGATGPLKGARRLWGKKRPKELSKLADETARRLGISKTAFEDALCNWQK
jgi:hypothetical protein